MKKTLLYLTCLLLFLLPWQTRLLYHTASLNGGFWEYGSDSLYGTELLLGVILLLAIIALLRDTEIRKRIFSKEHFVSRKKIMQYFVLVVVFIFLQTGLSLSRSISWGWVVHGIEAACIALLIIIHRKYRLSLIASLWLGGVVQALFAMQQFIAQEVLSNKWLGVAFHASRQLGDYAIEFGSGDMAERWLRAYGSFGSPNILGGFLAVVWLVGIIVYVELQRQDRRKAALLVSVGNVFITIGLALSFSRSAWLGAAAGAVVIVVGAVRTLSLRQVAKQLFFSAITVVVLFAIYRPLFLARATAEGRLENKSLIERQTQYAEATKIINKHALWGVGPGAYTLALYKNNPRRMSWEYQPVHNVWVLAWAEMGIVGFGLLLLLHYYIIKFLWKYNKVFLAILVPIIAISFFDHYWWSLYSGMIVWGAAIGLCLANMPEQKNQPV